MSVHTSPARLAPWLALGAALGPALFTVAWFVLGFLSPGYEVGGDWIAPYDPVSQPISGLGMGETGPAMNAAFVLGGLLSGIGAAGAMATIRPAGRPGLTRAATVLLLLSPAGLVLAGVFTLDHQLPHFLGFLLVAGVPVVGLPVTGVLLRTLPGWRRLGTSLVAAGPLTLVCLVAYLVSFDQASAGANEGVAGLTSRLVGLAIHVWYAVLGVLAFRRRAEVVTGVTTS